VWRTVPTDRIQAQAISQLVSTKVEPQLRATGVLGASDTLRLAVVHKGDAYGTGLADVLFQELRFNGKTPTDNGHDYLEIDYGDIGNPALAAAPASVVAFKPHVVILAGTVEAVTDVLGPLESTWPGDLPYRPRYVMTDGTQTPEIWSIVGTNADLRRRILGTIFGANSTLYSRFQAHYRSVINDGSVAEQSSGGNYDATYLLAYATAAIGPGITGASLNEGLKRVVSKGGVPIDVGPEQISDALTALLGGQTIDFTGAAGGYGYDVATGEPVGDFQIWCIDVDASGAASGFLQSGLSYSATTGMLVGSAQCP
jgi:branched-chain amino acid transport system substrate-binding protein